MVLVGEVAHYDLYRSIAIVQWNELFQRGFVTDSVKCIGIVQEYWYCSLIQIQGFSNNISEFKWKGCCRMTLTKTDWVEL